MQTNASPRRGWSISERLVDFSKLFPELKEDDEFRDLLQVANDTLVGGIRLEHDDSLVPCFDQQGLGRDHKEMESVICRLACESWEGGGSLVFTWSDLAAVVAMSNERLHLQRSGWAPKQTGLVMKPKGRWTNNPTQFNNIPSRSAAQGRVKLKYKREIRNVTIQQIIERLLHLEHLLEEGAINGTEATEECLVLFKSDLKGAFTLLDLHPDSALLQCYEIGHGLVAVCLRGTFGTVELPFAFFIISELLDRGGRVLGRRATFDLGVYVDDTCGGALVQRKILVEQMRERVFKPLLGAYQVLLGPVSVEYEKTEFGSVLDFLGWRVDVEARTVRVSDKTLLKLVYYLSLVQNGRAKGTTMEIITSLAERMSAVNPLLRVFLPHLYSTYCFLRCKDATVSLQGLAVTAVCVVKNLAYADFRKPAFSFDAFRPRTSSWHVQFDGSNKGVGAVVSQRVNGQWEMRGQISLALPGELAASEALRDKVQNGCELLAATAGLLAVALLDETAAVGVSVRGDSEVVAKHWLKDGRFKGEPGMRAALAVVVAEHHRDLRVVEHEWCSKHDNTHCDVLSRMHAIPHFSGTWTVSAQICPELLLPVRQMIEMCNPWIALQQPLDSPGRLEGFLSDLSALLPPRV